ncbi:MAG: hypothetical protein JNM48_06450 [Rhodospirillales bacterium]|nr:hypothetical protein [Rhodospirillales bacterium]
MTEYLLALWYRRWLLALVAIPVAILSIAAAYLVPPVYRSTVTLMIEEAAVPGDLASSTVSGFADQRLQAINMKVLASANLLAVIEAFDLYPESRGRVPDEALVDRMRRALAFTPATVEIKSAAKDRPVEATIGFNVSFDYRDPQVAQHVLQRLVDLYLGMNKSERIRIADETRSFLTAEASRLNEQLSAMDGQLREFRNKYAGSLPEEIDDIRRLTEKKREDLRDVDRQVQLETGRRWDFESQREQFSPYRSHIVNGQGVLNPADQLATLQMQLAIASSQYGPKHPSVLDLQEKIRETEKLIDGGDRTGQKAARKTPDNPPYLQADAMVRGAEATLQMLLTKRSELKAELESLPAREKQARLSEGEYAQLRRTYEQELQKYLEVRDKLSMAESGHLLEAGEKSGSVSVIEPASLPWRTAKPVRLLMIGAGAMLSLMAGLAAVLLAEYLRPRLYSRRQVRAILGPVPVVVVPRVRLRPQLLAARRLVVWLLCAASLAGAMPAGAALREAPASVPASAIAAGNPEQANAPASVESQ